MFNRKKQFHKTKEQILFEKEQKSIMEERKAFIDNKFMPFIESIDKDLSGSIQLCETVKMGLQQAFQNLGKTMKVSELGLEEQLNKNKPELTELPRRVLNLLADQTLNDATDILQALSNEINRLLWERNKTIKLKDFNAKDKN